MRTAGLLSDRLVLSVVLRAILARLLPFVPKTARFFVALCASICHSFSGGRAALIRRGVHRVQAVHEVEICVRGAVQAHHESGLLGRVETSQLLLDLLMIGQTTEQATNGEVRIGGGVQMRMLERVHGCSGGQRIASRSEQASREAHRVEARIGRHARKSTAIITRASTAAVRVGRVVVLLVVVAVAVRAVYGVLFLVALAADLVLGRLLVRDVLLLLPFGAAILEPDLHLGLGHVQERGDLGALTRRQVLLGLELLLQLKDLPTAECRARLFLLLAVRVVVAIRA